MSAVFEVITSEFVEDMEAIRSLVRAVDASTAAKIRIAAANSATLLVAATFEDFVREMAREFARIVVCNAKSVDALPPKLASTAWKRTLEDLSKLRLHDEQSGDGMEHGFGSAKARFTAVHEFCMGDLTQDIYRDLIHNQNNMRPSELNRLFKVSGLRDVCALVSERHPILEELGESESEMAHGKLISTLENFFERRNVIAHALKPGQSSGAFQIGSDINLLENFGRALLEVVSSRVKVLSEDSNYTGTAADHL